MAEFKSEISQAHVLRQAVLNTSSSIELLREAVSNSVDAGASEIDVRLENAGGDLWNITIQDNGNGMQEEHVRAYFNAGDSVKDFADSSGGTLSIGEKGLGSKTAFVAKHIHIESRRFDAPKSLLVADMYDPMQTLSGGLMPTYTTTRDPESYQSQLVTQGTRITLSEVLVTSFNGKRSDDASEICLRIMHYLRSMCATGTVKNRHAARTHIIKSVFRAGNIPLVSVEVITASGTATRGPESGSYDVPATELTPSVGPTNAEGVEERSKNFCDVLDFSRSRTISVDGVVKTVFYDGTAIIGGDNVRAGLLEGELKQGWTQKSQMGLHLCKDFIPLRNDTSRSRELLGGEYYYEFKVFLNSQEFQLTADRNVITNEDSDEVNWIWDDFRQVVWPSIETRARLYRQMRDEEAASTDAIRKTKASQALKANYSALADITVSKPGSNLAFVKVPQKEADASHLLAMMVESRLWERELSPIAKFGRYIDDSTDLIVEDESGNPLLAEVEMRLTNLFSHKHPMGSYDLVVVWELGSVTHGSAHSAPWGLNGDSVLVSLISGTPKNDWHLKWGTTTKRVIVLSELL